MNHISVWGIKICVLVPRETSQEASILLWLESFETVFFFHFRPVFKIKYSYFFVCSCYVFRWIWCLRCYCECSSTPGRLKSLLGHGGNRTLDLWYPSPMLCQLSYKVKSVRVGDISELSLVHSTSVYSKIWYFLCVLVLCTQVNMMFVQKEYIHIEGTRLSSEISPTRTELNS